MMPTAMEMAPVVELSAHELREAAVATLRESGYTFAELQAQAHAGHFAGLNARLTWLALKDLGELVR